LNKGKLKRKKKSWYVLHSMLGGLPWFGGLETPIMVSISKNQIGIGFDFLNRTCN
jgi:hypothetical protein